MLSNQFEMEVLVNGKPVQEYLHNNEQFIEGKEGTEFSLKLRNRSGKRALFVPTIDGLSVMDGKEASFKSSGYILDGYESYAIEGWRLSDDNIAKFFFSKIKDSYAAKSGKEGNVGVIGCAVFREKEKEPERIIIEKHIINNYPAYPRCPHWHLNGYACGCNGVLYSYTNSGTTTITAGWQASATGSSMLMASASNTSNQIDMSKGEMLAAMQANSSLGTGFGEQKYAPVKTVDFERATEKPYLVMTMRYNTRENLKAMGIQFKKVAYISPSPFPKEEEVFCKPPQGWEGN